MKNFLLLITVLAFYFTLSACKTVEGFGEDLQSLGKGIEKSANQ